METLWQIADNFRFWVCRELRELSAEERASLRGDYLFIIDSKPSFIVMVNEAGAWSVTLSQQWDSNQKEFILTYDVEEGCPFSVTSQSLLNCIHYSARTTISTNFNTLQKLLLGRMKAKVAFLTSQVMLTGDLPAFLKMVSILKRRGVGPFETKEQLPLTNDV